MTYVMGKKKREKWYSLIYQRYLWTS
jgi:hypothetical protein